MDAISLSSGNKLAGRYRVLQKLGEGSFAETFLSEDEHLPDAFQCVIKKLKTEVEEAAKLQIAKRLFDEEARTLHQLGSHPNIPQLLAHFEEDGEFYLVEEYVEGSSLFQELGTGQRWSEGYVTKLIKDILEVLAFVHQKHVIHRDIKPSNIIRREKDGRIFLIDFGAVKQVAKQAADDNTMAPHTVIVGTPGYMPGEQLRGSPRTSSDVFAVGMIAIYALTGLNPALGQIPEDEQTAEVVWHDRADASPELTAIIDKMVAYDFRQRYPSAGEALDALKALTLHRQEGADATVLKDTPNNGFSNVVAGPTGSGVGSNSGLSYNGKPIGGVANSALNSTPTPSTALEKTSMSPRDVDGSPAREGSGAGTFVVSGMGPGQVVKPEPATSPPSTRRFFDPKLVALGGAAVLGLGTIAALASPNIEPLCNALNNCSVEVKYNNTYEDGKNKAEAALTAVNNAKSFKDLQNADSQLKDSIQKLSKIPEGMNSYKDAQKVLPNYQKQLKSLVERITTEKKAQEDLKKADAIAKPILAQKKISGSVASLSESKAQMQKAIDGVNKIPDNSLTAPERKVQKQAYVDRQKAINIELKKQSEKEAAAQAEWERQQAASAARRAPSGGSGSSGGGGSSTGGSEPSGGSSGGGSSGGGGNSAYVPPEPAPAPASGNGGGGSAARQEPAPAPAAQEPLWGGGGSGGGSGSGSSAGGGGGGGEPLW
jgi:serine/threonine protein kinase